MYEAILRIADSAPPVETSGRDARVALWCNDHCDLIRVVGADADSMVEAVDTAVGVADALRQGDEIVVVTEDCFAAHRQDNVERYVSRHGCLLLPPLRYANGDRICRLLALDPGTLRDVYRDLVADDHAVTVESKRSVDGVAGGAPLLDPDGLLPDLTSRQREALFAAIDGGYYEIPREITTAEIADAVGVERRTVEDHLRRAERKLVTQLSSHLR